MEEQFRSCLIAILVVAPVLIVVEIRVYGTGFAGKTLFDWLSLLGVLAIPLGVGFGVAWITRTQQLRDQEHEKLQRERDQQFADQRADSERAIALDNQREAALTEYLDKMSELLLHAKLLGSAVEDEVQKIARIRTLTVLRGLDASRRASVIQFLYEANLIDKDTRIINLSDANASGVNLESTDLSISDKAQSEQYRSFVLHLCSQACRK